MSRPATGLRSANYTGYSSINGNNFFTDYNLRSSYLTHSFRQIPFNVETSRLKSSRGSRFDPFNQHANTVLQTANNVGQDPLAAIISKEKQSIYDKMRQLEKIIHGLVESSSLAASRGEYKLALLKAKDSQSKIVSLKRIYDKNSLSIERLSSSSDSTYLTTDLDKQAEESLIPLTNGVSIHEDLLMVNMNLALQYLNNGHLQQALDICNEFDNNLASRSTNPGLIGGDRSGSSITDKVIARFGINIANEYFRQGHYQRALKYYRLTLDRISSNDYNTFRTKIMCNIGLTFIELKQYTEAITSYNQIITTDNDLTNTPGNTNTNLHHHQCGFHSILCNYIIRDMDSMKTAFQILIATKLPGQFEDTLNDSLEKKSLDLAITESDQILLEREQESSVLKRILDQNKATVVEDDVIGRVGQSGHSLARKIKTSSSFMPSDSERFSATSDRIMSSNSSGVVNLSGSIASVSSLSATSSTATTIRQDLSTRLYGTSSEVIVDVPSHSGYVEPSTTTTSLIRSAFRNDPLRKFIRAKINHVHRSILFGAKLIAKLDDMPSQHDQRGVDNFSSLNESYMMQSKDQYIRKSSTSRLRSDGGTISPINRSSNSIKNQSDGLDYCVSTLQRSKYFQDLVSDLEISKAMNHINKQQFEMAIETLKIMEASGKANQNTRSSSMATTNLSLLYSLRNELTLATNYAEQAISIDPYNANAYVNLGNSLHHQKNYEQAEICYKKAIEVDINCTEAHYNLILLYRLMKQSDKSLGSLMKLQSTMKGFHPLMVQAVKIYTSMGDKKRSLELLYHLMDVAPRDPSLLLEMSEIAEEESDYSSMRILTEAYRCLPSNIKTMERLVAIYINGGAYEKAIELLEDCSSLRPDQDKWLMMIAGCLRRSGEYHQALHWYKKVNSMFPNNTTCLKTLIQLCQDLGLEETGIYESKLVKISKKSGQLQEIQEAHKNVASGKKISNSIASAHSDIPSGKINKLRILDEDLLKISARPSTMEKMNKRFSISPSDLNDDEDEDPILIRGNSEK